MFKKLWNKIKNLFSTLESVPDLPEKLKFEKIAILVGHNKAAPGCDTYSGISEYEFNTKIVGGIQTKLLTDYDILSNRVRVFFKDGYNSSSIAASMERWGAECCIELHLNSNDTVAYGCEILLVNGQNRNPAATFIDQFSKIMEIKPRHDKGIKWLGRYDRGYLNVKSMLSRGIYGMLLEPAFVNIPTADAEKVIGDPVRYATVLALLISRMLE